MTTLTEAVYRSLRERANEVVEFFEAELSVRCERSDDKTTPIACDRHYSEWLETEGTCYWMSQSEAAIAAYRREAVLMLP